MDVRLQLARKIVNNYRSSSHIVDKSLVVLRALTNFFKVFQVTEVRNISLFFTISTFHPVNRWRE